MYEESRPYLRDPGWALHLPMRVDRCNLHSQMLGRVLPPSVPGNQGNLLQLPRQSRKLQALSGPSGFLIASKLLINALLL